MIAVVPPLFVERLVSAVVPPTAPLNVVVPVVFTLSVNAPSSVVANVIPPEAASSTVFAPSITASLYTWLSALPVVTDPPLMAVEPPALVSRWVRADVEPTAPPNVVVPVVFASSRYTPSSVVTNVIAPLPASSTVFAPSVTASL